MFNCCKKAPVRRKKKKKKKRNDDELDDVERDGLTGQPYDYEDNGDDGFEDEPNNRIDSNDAVDDEKEDGISTTGATVGANVLSNQGKVL